MLTRLGKVVYWGGCVLSALMLAAGGILFSGMRPAEALANEGFVAIATALVWLVGEVQNTFFLASDGRRVALAALPRSPAAEKIVRADVA
jgi:hypothetical protein